MNRFYFLVAEETEGSDYIYLDDDRVPDELKRGCRNSEFQFIDPEITVLTADPESGNSLPDFICDGRNDVPLISERMKSVFDSLNVRFIFYQRIRIIKNSDGLSENYWLAVPPRIDCLDRDLDRDKSDIDEMWNKAKKIVIDRDKTGNCDIFKISGVVNNEIIISSRLKNALEKHKVTKGFYMLDDPKLE